MKRRSARRIRKRAGARRLATARDSARAENAVRIGGRIDRIDVGRIEGATVFTVDRLQDRPAHGTKLDTAASGRLAADRPVHAGRRARLELAGAGARPWQMGYWHIRETGFASEAKTGRLKAGEPLPPLDGVVWESLVQTLEQIIPRLAAGIRAGQFPVYNADPDCTAGCPYNTVCRVAQVRALPPEMEKTWSP